ncbi:tyrosine-type recombinase/integrase [Roseibacillus ishigakijimensis]|uniref:Tyrosine-type recombinase/integrase n=1 Tax=Roseibacillus ishigakijimensis TaxID=454146 RepID=A0A934RQD3_9BACT|nr:site-specific integrase [Roseibacillus ishigakijimensis]MBK1835559.1 tyrosine-type recombinase/integrase [Roseibacillus ishigakijimensis]
MQAEEKVTIKELSAENVMRKKRGYRWVVESRIGGKRSRKFFRHGEQDKAKALKSELERQRDTISKSNRELLDETLLTEATEATKQLKPHGKSLSDAVAFYLAHLKEKARQDGATIEEGIGLYLDAMEARELDVKTIRRARQTLNRFSAAHPRRTLASLKGPEIRAWWETFGGVVNQRANRTDVNTFLNWIVKSERFPNFTENPTPPAPELPKKRKAKVILTPPDVRRLLECADRELLPAIVAQVFIGVRKEEALRLRWEHFDWEEEELSVPEDVTKGRENHVRINRIPPNALQWLKPYFDQEGGPVLPAYKTVDTYEKALSRIRKKAGWNQENPWPRNALRKTFISCHVASYSDIGKTAAIAGTSEAVIFRNYRALVKKSLAKKLWEIYPPQEEGKIVELSNNKRKSA